MHEELGFGPRLLTLRDMEVHFVSIKVGVVRWADAWIEAECLVWQDLYSMRHDRHSMERWLPVEEYDVPVSNVSFNYEAGLDCFRETFALGNEFESDSSPVWSYYVQCARILIGPVANKVSEFL